MIRPPPCGGRHGLVSQKAWRARGARRFRSRRGGGGSTPTPPRNSRLRSTVFSRRRTSNRARKMFSGLVSPHAGYIYSGPCAAHGYRLVQGRRYDVVVVIGLSHRVPGSVSVLNAESYVTPLGKIPIDREGARRLIVSEDFIDDDAGLFSMEHSIEVQLPFLQRALPDLKVVLVSMRTMARERCERLAAALDRVFGGRRVLYIASSDLSHFHSYDEARRLDLGVLERVRAMNLDGLADDCATGRGEMCGIAPVLTVLELYKRSARGDAPKFCVIRTRAIRRERATALSATARWRCLPRMPRRR
ncbi:MAG: AmmeMemoRadiSam system protein B [Deltaproteobacteria bacterium]|nr:AmmeMemoRadiSam system protein B [Deltaproteobacteria bacterium]